MRSTFWNGFSVTTLALTLCFSVSLSMAQQSDNLSNMPGMKMDAAKTPEATASGTIGSIDLSGGYVKAMLPGQPVGGGYVSIHNGGSADDRLVSVSSSAAGEVELHEMSMKGDVMIMRELKDGIAVPAGATVTLSPNTLHMMFKQVKSPFKQGGSVPVQLVFEKAGSVDLVLPVSSPKGK